MHVPSPADATIPGLKSSSGVVCPRCRYTAPEPAGGASLTCPRDGFALVAAAALVEADGDPFLGTTVGGRFVVLERLGAGAMGTVYRARHEAMRRDVALKIVRSERAYDAQARGRFEREARAMSRLASPHTVTVFDFGEIVSEGSLDGFGPEVSLYLAMELLVGESLGQRLRRVGRLPVEEACRFARHALLSLVEAHDKGIVHRDLKPDNLFIVQPPEGGEPHCKVLDFGIAKVTAESGFDAAADAVETQAGTVFGTPRYMSPEQAQGKPLDARSDLYSLGVLLYQMLVGRPPFVDDDAVVVMAQHIRTLPRSPAECAPDAKIGRALDSLVMSALAKSSADRPSDARQFIERLDAALRDRAAGGALASGELGAVVTQVASTIGSKKTWLVGAVVAALAGSAALGYALVSAIASPTARPDVAYTGLSPSSTPAIAAEPAIMEVSALGDLPDEAEAAASAPAALSAAPDAATSASAPTRPRPSARPLKKYRRFE